MVLEGIHSLLLLMLNFCVVDQICAIFLLVPDNHLLGKNVGRRISDADAPSFHTKV